MYSELSIERGPKFYGLKQGNVRRTALNNIQSKEEIEKNQVPIVINFPFIDDGLKGDTHLLTEKDEANLFDIIGRLNELITFVPFTKEFQETVCWTSINAEMFEEDATVDERLYDVEIFVFQEINRNIKIKTNFIYHQFPLEKYFPTLSENSYDKLNLLNDMFEKVFTILFNGKLCPESYLEDMNAILREVNYQAGEVLAFHVDETMGNYDDSLTVSKKDEKPSKQETDSSSEEDEEAFVAPKEKETSKDTVEDVPIDPLDGVVDPLSETLENELKEELENELTFDMDEDDDEEF